MSEDAVVNQGVGPRVKVRHSLKMAYVYSIDYLYVGMW